MNGELWVFITEILIRSELKYQMKSLNFYLGVLSAVRLREQWKPNRELTTSSDAENENRLLSEAAINQVLNLDLFQGDIITYTQPSSRNILKDLTKRWPKWVCGLKEILTYKKHILFLLLCDKIFKWDVIHQNWTWSIRRYYRCCVSSNKRNRS